MKKSWERSVQAEVSRFKTLGLHRALHFDSVPGTDCMKGVIL